MNSKYRIPKTDFKGHIVLKSEFGAVQLKVKAVPRIL